MPKLSSYKFFFQYVYGDQMLMNAMTEHTSAIRCASTLTALTRVHAGVAIDLIQMGTVALVNSEQN